MSDLPKEVVEKIKKKAVHRLNCQGCEECSNGDENRQEFKDPLK